MTVGNDKTWSFDPDRIRILRELKGLKHDAFAKKLGCAPALVRAWEEARRFPSMPSLLKICNVFSVLPASFFIKKLYHNDKRQ